MRFKNLTPFLFGPKVCSRNPPRPEMSLVVRASYRLRPGEPLTVLEEMDQGKLSAESYDEEDAERAGEVVRPGDFADYKPRADLLLRGTCHAPGRVPATTCRVSFGVGAWSKEVMVFGDRAWKKGLVVDSMSDPESFTEMPITYANSFGGPGHPANPAGKGCGDNLQVPNIQDPEKPIRSRRDRQAPACFGPANPAWEPRVKKRGRKYGKRWKKERSPYYSEDFDWAYFNEAPPDQQIEGYLVGDEPVRFVNLHPDAAEFTIRLPGTRVRAFVKDQENRFREMATHLDTLYANPDEELLTLTWRGLVEVRQPDMTDVTTVLIASEKLADPPLPPEHYRELLDAFEKDPLGLDDLPEDMKAGKAFLDAVEESKLEECSADDFIGTLGGLLEKALAIGGGSGAGVREALATAAAAAERHGVNLGAALAQVMAAPPPASPAPGAMPRAPIGDALAKVGQAIDSARAAVKDSGGDPRILDPVDDLLKDPRLSQLDPGYRPPGEEKRRTENPGPGADLTGQDLSGRDLSGADLSGANLKATDLSRANLAGAKLVGANLEATVLYGANLAGADLSETTIKSANLSLADARGARFDRATVEQSIFDMAILTEASLEGLSASTCSFTEADLSRAVVREANVAQSDFTQATLEQTDFSGSTLTRSFCDETAMSGVVMRGTDLSNTSFRHSDLRQADFREATGDPTNWQEARLDGADFSRACLPSAQFPEVSAKRADFSGANLRDARFHKASLEEVSMARANLFGADLSRSSLLRTRFTDANLYDAKFFKAKLDRCDFAGANLKRALLETE